MEYQFYQDPGLGCQAEFAMPHEAFGNWLSENLCSSGSLPELRQIISRTEELLNRQRWHWQLEQEDYILTLEDGSAQIRHQSLNDDQHNGGLTDEHIESGHETDAYYDQESAGDCGLEDFIAALRDWYEFVGQHAN